MMQIRRPEGGAPEELSLVQRADNFPREREEPSRQRPNSVVRDGCEIWILPFQSLDGSFLRGLSVVASLVAERSLEANAEFATQVENRRVQLARVGVPLDLSESGFA